MSRALLVIDVQREYFEGALPISYPNGHLETILNAMDAARAARVPIVVVRHHQPDPNSPIFCLSSEMWKLHTEVEQRPRDLLLDKQLPGAFTGTALENWLRDQKIETVAISGYMTHMCCDTTARQAFHRGLNVEFLSDATGTLTVENKAGRAEASSMQESILVAQQMFISDVLNTKEWIDRLGE